MFDLSQLNPMPQSLIEKSLRITKIGMGDNHHILIQNFMQKEPTPFGNYKLMGHYVGREN